MVSLAQAVKKIEKERKKWNMTEEDSFDFDLESLNDLDLIDEEPEEPKDPKSQAEAEKDKQIAELKRQKWEIENKIKELSGLYTAKTGKARIAFDNKKKVYRLAVYQEYYAWLDKKEKKRRWIPVIEGMSVEEVLKKNRALIRDLKELDKQAKAK